MLRLTDSQEFPTVSFSAEDKVNNPAPVENVKLTSSDDSIVTVTANGDGTYKVTTTGKLGTVQLNAQADARIGDGEKLLFGTETIEVVAGEAVAIALNPGEPAERAL